MAFPETSSLLDNFNRANGNVSTGASQWENLGLHDALATGITVISEKAGSTGDNSVRSTSTFGPNMELYATISTLPAQYFFFPILVASPGASWNGYGLIYLIGGTWQIRRYASGSNTTIKEAVLEIAAGDKVGISHVGTKLTVYREHLGTWSEVTSVTDATYSAAGRIGLWVGDSTVRIDELFVGTISSGSTSQGKAAGTAAGSGAAAGIAIPSPTKQGKVAGTAAVSGAAKGQVVHEGKAAGSATGGGTAVGTAIGAATSQGKAAGTATGSGSAKGTAIAPSVAQGKAAGTAAGSGTAKGVVIHEGKAAGSASGSGTAAGTASSAGTAQGRAAGTAAGSGSAAARVTHRGIAAGTAHISGAARPVEPEHVAVLRVSYPAYFPTGTTVELYVDPHIGDVLDLGYESVPVTRFLGPVVATQVMPSSEEIEFTGTGIEEEEDYLAYANVGGDQRLVRLRLSSQR